jgi:protein ImuB
VARLACVDVPALPLQLLGRRHPEWVGLPVAVVAEESLQARLLWVNERARQLRILPGTRYTAALSLSGDLRAGVVRSDEIAAAVRQITDRLQDFSPEVEPSAEEPGVFWLDGEGLNRLFRSAAAWGLAIRDGLRGLGFSARVVVGFTRYGTYAIARSRTAGAAEPLAFESLAEEERAARAAPLDRLGLPPEERDDLAKLGVATLGDFLALPAGGLRERFDEPAARVHDLASGTAWTPLQPVPPAERLVAGIDLDFADDDLSRLLFVLKQLLDPLLARLAARREGARELSLDLHLDPPATRHEVFRPAQPARVAQPILELVRLRLESSLPGKVEAMEAELTGVPLDPGQTQLFAQTPRRDLDAANRALARLRAEFGAAAVARARVCEGHLPEAAFLWEPLERLEDGCEAEGTMGLKEHGGPPPILVRRILERPAIFSPSPQIEGGEQPSVSVAGTGPIAARTGPYVISGGWWVHPIHREYYFAHTQGGEVLWVYYDRRRRHWFLQGAVE